ncbi:type II toxin-antitoxin system Phd/YefM family antitoxin [Rickettsia endosymbiont of Orchestes rusci]|uniref:type II toxin-antitoxin system Phd/YefM family antitoxin n=1 Tax=Rickettsia endosymbiont of Orchestes rusci TaxID=3066250 RepID=UPI00313CB5AC
MSTNVAISEFKSHCSEILEDLQKTHQSIIITKRNIPIAKLEALTAKPKASKKPTTSIFGIMKGKGTITGDIISPIWDIKDE